MLDLRYSLLLAAFSLVMLSFLLGYMGYLGFGFTTLSLSSVDFKTNDPTGFLQGPVFALTVRQGGLAQHAEGYFSPQVIKDEGKMVRKGFKLEIDNFEQRCRYPVRVDYSEKIYKYGLVDCGLFEPLESCKSKCARFGEVIGWGKAVGELTGYCVYGSPVASYTGRLKDVADYGFRAKLKLTIDGKSPVTATISSTGAGEARLGNVALAVWQGNLVTGASCPVPSSDRVMAVYSKGWRLINASYFDSYKNKSDDLKASFGVHSTQIRLKIEQVNAAADAALRPVSWNNAVGVDSFSVENGYFFVDLPKQLQFPVFTIYVKADELGLYQPIGKAVILSAQGSTFKTGEDGVIRVDFMNESSVDAGFQVWVECSPGFSMKGSVIERQLRAGVRDTVFIPVTGSCSSTKSGNCKVYVKALGGGTPVTANVSMTCSPQQVCDPGKVSCISNVIKQCNSDGTAWLTLEDCASKGQVCVSNSLGQLSCGSGSNAGTPLPGFDFAGLLFWVSIVLVLILLLFVFIIIIRVIR